MSDLVIDDELAAKLGETTEPVDLRTRDGRRLGTFTPDPPTDPPAAVLAWIVANRIVPKPGTLDSTEMLREDRDR